MSATSPTRPVSSKARGICKYYLTSRGCWAGDQCKFLHGGSHTPYDLSKTCRFYARGFCKHGAKCWFSHDREALIEEEDDLCSICFEKPVTYGLLTACNHIFCITCIKQWRSASNPDVVESGNTKRCPMCRTASKFIIPSSKFYVHGQSGKDEAITRYKASMKRIPCKHFQRSLDNRSTPFCKYGRDCFYLHRNIDGSEYVPAHGIDTFVRAMFGSIQYLTIPQQHFGISNRVDLIRSLENVFAETARLGLATPFPAGGGDDDITVMHRLELLV
ncbi:hypothetical protein C8F01DRAFT_982015 [Mycena amicta]|nr:hypothetical protein C8F01DRAFT_982015 [Mycena amicta]